MKPQEFLLEPLESAEPVTADMPGASDLLTPLLQARSGAVTEPVHGVLTGTLLALADEGRTPLVCFAGQPGDAAQPARTTVDLHGAHIGHSVVLMFEQGDVRRPIVMGVVRGPGAWPLAEQPATVDVDVDGARMVVSASEQLVLRCGKASITLTKCGKVMIDGHYVVSRSTGVNRVKGGSVQIN